MITPILERLILRGKAKYRVFNHNFASYGKIIVPKKSMIIITEIIYYPHINLDNFVTLKDVMTYYNESQLCLQSESNINFYNFKNAIDVTVLKPTGLIDPINDLPVFEFNNLFIQPKPPIKIDTFLVNTKDITIRITRNLSYKYGYALPNGAIETAPIPAETGEEPLPRGLMGQDTINRARGGAGDLANDPGAIVYKPYPNTIANETINDTEQYSQGYTTQGIQKVNSVYSSINSQPDITAQQAFPLITFGLVEITDVDVLKELNEKYLVEGERL